MGNWLKRATRYNPQDPSSSAAPSSPQTSATKTETEPLSNPPPPPADTAADNEREGEKGGEREGEGEGEKEVGKGGEREGEKEGEGEGEREGEKEVEGEGEKEGEGEGEKEGEGEGEREGEGEGEREGETEREGEGVTELAATSDSKRDKSPSPSDPIPLNRVAELRKDSEFSFHVGSTESLVGIFTTERLNPSDYRKPIKFKKIQPTIRTGDLALLYRRGEVHPHLAIFINHLEADPLFPLLLVKGKTKPLPKEKFCPGKPRFIHPITATTRIFYGDYEKVAIRYIDSPLQISVKEAMDAITKVEATPFSEKEREVISGATTDHERSLFMSTFMAAHYYYVLGVFDGSAEEATPESLLRDLPLLDPIFVKLPTVKLGPMVNGEPPFLKQLM